jgi:putative transposase
MLARNDVFTTPADLRFRLLDIDEKGRIAHIFPLQGENPMPRQRKLADLVASLKSCEYKRVSGSESASASINPNEKAQAAGKARWLLIEPLVRDPDIYFRSARGKLVMARSKQTGKSEQTILTCLRLYWSGGMTRDALIPEFHKRGTDARDEATKAAIPVTSVPGRTPEGERYVKYIFPASLKKKIVAFTKRLLNSKNTKTRRFAYNRVISQFFSIVKGDGTKAQLPLGERPSRAQFLYLLDQNQTREEVLRRRVGDDNYDNNHKPLTGGILMDCRCVGQYYEIDSTIVDVLIVARDNRLKVIGKATLYLILDRFSGYIPGFHVSLDKPSWAGAMEAVLSLVEDKQEMCKKFGFPYDPEDWLAHGLMPQFFVADRGSEFIGHWSDSVVEGVQIGFVNVPARHAPRKSWVELSFKVTQVSLKDHVGGYTPPAEAGKRQIENRSLEADRTLDELRVEIMYAMRKHNNSVIRARKLPARDVYKDRQAIPKKIWEIDYAENVGMMSRFEENVLRFKVLPKAEATVTGQGIKYRGLFYESAKILNDEWLVRAQKKHFKVPITVDRRRVDVIYIHDDKDPAKWDVAHLTGKSAEYAGWSFAELDALDHARKPLGWEAEEINLGVEINHSDAAEARAKAARKLTKAAIAKAGGASRTSGGKELREKEIEKDRVQATLLKSLVLPPTAAPGATSPLALEAVSTQATSSLSQAATGRPVVPAPPPLPALVRPPTAKNNALAALLKLKK